MARPTYPRRQGEQERQAAEVLRRYATRTGWVPTLPVPIEEIVQETYGIRIETWALEEIPGGRLLGALFANDASIVINERYGDLFMRRSGSVRVHPCP